MLIRLKQLTWSLCLIGVSTATFAQTVLVRSQHQINEYQLDNGLRVILAPNNNENKVFMNTVYLTGSLNDPQGKGGLAHLLEHLAFKGTQDVQGEEFQRRLDQYTLATNASTDYYSTKYTNIIRPDPKAIDQVLYLEAQRMDKLVLQQKFVPSEIETVRRERELRLDQPFAVLMDQMFKAAYGNRDLGRLPIGDLNELKSIQMKELNQFYRQWYAPNNAVMVITGKFDQAQVLQRIEQNFGKIQAHAVPAMAKVPLLDASKIQQRQLSVQKGSDLAKVNMYLNGRDLKIQPVLAVAPYLYTLQPSGQLYKTMVETGMTTTVQSTTWLDQDFNVVFMGAIYAPTQDAQQISKNLAQDIETPAHFNDADLNRVKSVFKNQADSIATNAVALGNRLSDYVVSSQGHWEQYFNDVQAVQNLTTQQVNQSLNTFFQPQHRISGDIQPTPDSQKKAMQLQPSQPKKPLQTAQSADSEPVKNIQQYQQEIQDYLTRSKQHLQTTEQQIQRGKLKNGLRYALFPVPTHDNKVYATISLNFGTEKSLWNKGQILDLTAYLLLRGSDQQTLQQVIDHSIAADGQATAVSQDNGMLIQIQANKQHFADYFQYIVGIMQHPSFEQSQFDLIKSQSLASLNRPYTEPETVAALTMSRLVEQYAAGDLRYHFEPEQVKQQLQAVTQPQVQQLYRQFMGFNHAELAMTGEFNTQQMHDLINRQFATWSSKQNYQRLSSAYKNYPATQVHALAEQREFGNYQGLLVLPVGIDDTDAPALQVLSYILGDSQLSSRLGQELREKNHLVYGFSSDLNLDLHDSVGVLTIQANYTANKAAQTSQAVHHVLQDLIQKGITPQELAAAKANILKQRVTSLEDSRIIHQMLNSQLERGKTMSSREQRDQAIARLSKADVDSVIKKYIQLDHYVEVMADQYGQQQTDLKVAALGK
ncbi:M16 family metallopeptidase [Acinetobacter brisouii]|uniref:M16 family metallopeptidase n=1 Tax=Acinetobacter brisouii TaxID=396323 RepID=UPI0005F857E7|nr:M16 family metallopeptidase [Acinetobacter brisouii]KJV40432.1 protease [Acinetobacter brisouii]